MCAGWPGVLKEQVGGVQAASPAGVLEHRARIEGAYPADAEDALRSRTVGQVQQFRQRIGIEERDPAKANTFGAGRQSHVLDSATDRGNVHLGQLAPSNQMLLTPRHQGHYQQFRALANPFDLHAEEFVVARRQCVGGG